jgi:ClpP class serine protease
MNKKLPVIGIITLFFISIVVQVIQYEPKSSSSNSDIFQSKAGIGVIDIYGPIAFASPSQSFIPMGADAIIAQLKAAEENKRVKAVILRINSPGGTVCA